MAVLISTFRKLSDYFLAKITSVITKDVPIKPLFPSMTEPADSKIGHLMELVCGHNGKPTNDDYITMTLNMH